MEAIGAIQGLVSYHNVNSNKVSKFFSSFGGLLKRGRKWCRAKRYVHEKG